MGTEKSIAQFMLDYQFRLQPKTLIIYQRAIRQLLGYISQPVDAISTRDIRKWLSHLYESGYKSSTIRNKMIALKVYFKYCLEEGFTQNNPTENIELPKREDSIPYYLSGEQLVHLRKLLEGYSKERALIELFYATGVRISELADMKKADINWSDRTIIIPSGKGKKGRVVLFSLESSPHLEAYLDSRLDNLPAVFVNPHATRPIGISWINKRFQSYSKQLGFRITPHTLRHTFAAHLAQRGMPLTAIQKLLGHEDPITTQVYARLYEHARKELYDEWM